VGRPTELTEEEEAIIEERLILLSTWGFPLNSKDLCHLVKEYLDSAGRHTRFIDNLPGSDFFEGFLRRHPALSVRQANNLKRARAEVTVDVVQSFFEHYAKVVEGVPPTNIWNCDETNLQEDPGATKAIFKKGVKYAEQVRDHSKNAVSVLFCGSTAGELMPPYVTVKGKNVYSSWTKGGPPGTVYTATTSGWVDTWCFTDFIRQIFVPSTRRLTGKVVLICDNVSSHFGVEAVNLCRDNNIELVCFPPNTTDKLQPLDVGYFRSLKGGWRQQLRSFLAKDPSAKLLAKTEFPKMLKLLVDGVNHREILPAAFEKCGLWPVNPEKVGLGFRVPVLHYFFAKFKL